MFASVSLMLALTGCEETVKSTYRIEVGDMSSNSQANLLLQIAANEYVAEYNESAKTELRTEKEARSWFNSACDDIKNKVDAMGLPVMEDSWIIFELSDYTNVVDSKQVYFSESHS